MNFPGQVAAPGPGDINTGNSLQGPCQALGTGYRLGYQAGCVPTLLLAVLATGPAPYTLQLS